MSLQRLTVPAQRREPPCIIGFWILLATSIFNYLLSFQLLLPIYSSTTLSYYFPVYWLRWKLFPLWCHSHMLLRWKHHPSVTFNVAKLLQSWVRFAARANWACNALVVTDDNVYTVLSGWSIVGRKGADIAEYCKHDTTHSAIGTKSWCWWWEFENGQQEQTWWISRSGTDIGDHGASIIFFFFLYYFDEVGAIHSIIYPSCLSFPRSLTLSSSTSSFAN